MLRNPHPAGFEPAANAINKPEQHQVGKQNTSPGSCRELPGDPDRALFRPSKVVGSPASGSGSSTHLDHADLAFLCAKLALRKGTSHPIAFAFRRLTGRSRA